MPLDGLAINDPEFALGLPADAHGMLTGQIPYRLELIPENLGAQVPMMSRYPRGHEIGQRRPGSLMLLQPILNFEFKT